MIQPDKRIEETGFANLTDYSQKCAEGFRSWFAFVCMEDGSEALLSDIFAKNRLAANAIVFSRFADCLPSWQVGRSKRRSKLNDPLIFNGFTSPVRP